MKNSLKQLLRTPKKTLLFFLLLTGSTLLIVFGAVLLTDTSQRISAVAGQFTTLGTVDQGPSRTIEEIVADECQGARQGYTEEYDDAIPLAALNFEGANYSVPPESRPYYFAYLPEFTTSFQLSSYRDNIIEFTPKEDNDGYGPVEVEVTKVLYNNLPSSQIMDGGTQQLEAGDTISFCQHFDEARQPLEKGKTYIAELMGTYCPRHDAFEYTPVRAAFSTRCNTSGELLNTELASSRIPTQEVKPNFYETAAGTAWTTWASIQDDEDKWFYVLPANDLDMLPTFHDNRVTVQDGREITKEEFMAGKQVCMVTFDFASKNHISVGDAIRLPLRLSAYGWDHNDVAYSYQLASPIDSNGELLTPFFEAEYEVVGIFRNLTAKGLYGIESESEIPQDAILIPAASVTASDENNIVSFTGRMTARTTSFQIPNGTIAEFDMALHEAVPGVESLSITYNDRGYSEIMDNLTQTRTISLLLFIVGVLAAVVIILLLLYFFIIQQKKRTAIERSLGKTKRECRVSLLSGLLLMAAVAVILGTAGGMMIFVGHGSATGVSMPSETEAAIESAADIANNADFSTYYSMWAKATQDSIEIDAVTTQQTMGLICTVIPIAIFLLVFILALLLVNSNLKIEPIYLLSGKME